MEPWTGAESFPIPVAGTHNFRNGCMRGDLSGAPCMADECLGRVVDILEASGAFDPGSSPGRGVSFRFCFLTGCSRNTGIQDYKKKVIPSVR